MVAIIRVVRHGRVTNERWFVKGREQAVLEARHRHGILIEFL